MASAYPTLSMPAPPHSGGTATPPRPSSKAFFTASAGYLCSRSQRFELGLSSRPLRGLVLEAGGCVAMLALLRVLPLVAVRENGRRCERHRQDELSHGRFLPLTCALRQQVARDHHALDLRGPFVDLEELRVAH